MVHSWYAFCESDKCVMTCIHHDNIMQNSSSALKILCCIIYNVWCWASFHLLVCHLYAFLVRYLFTSFVHFLIELLIFSVLSLKSSLYILDKSFIRCVFCSQFVACLLTMLTVFGRGEVFNFNEVQRRNYFMNCAVGWLIFYKVYFFCVMIRKHSLEDTDSLQFIKASFMLYLPVYKSLFFH